MLMRHACAFLFSNNLHTRFDLDYKQRRRNVCYLFVDPKDPTFDVWVMIVGNVIDCENRAVLDGTTAVGPKCRITLRILNEITSKWVPADMYIDWK
jgi:hypothetical protein